jgi:hypothetical protein
MHGYNEDLTDEEERRILESLCLQFQLFPYDSLPQKVKKLAKTPRFQLTPRAPIASSPTMRSPNSSPPLTVSRSPSPIEEYSASSNSPRTTPPINSILPPDKHRSAPAVPNLNLASLSVAAEPRPYSFAGRTEPWEAKSDFEVCYEYSLARFKKIIVDYITLIASFKLREDDVFIERDEVVATENGGMMQLKKGELTLVARKYLCAASGHFGVGSNWVYKRYRLILRLAYLLYDNCLTQLPYAEGWSQDVGSRELGLFFCCLMYILSKLAKVENAYWWQPAQAFVKKSPWGTSSNKTYVLSRPSDYVTQLEGIVGSAFGQKEWKALSESQYEKWTFLTKMQRDQCVGMVEDLNNLFIYDGFVNSRNDPSNTVQNIMRWLLYEQIGIKDITLFDDSSSKIWQYIATYSPLSSDIQHQRFGGEYRSPNYHKRLVLKQYQNCFQLLPAKASSLSELEMQKVSCLLCILKLLPNYHNGVVEKNLCKLFACAENNLQLFCQKIMTWFRENFIAVRLTIYLDESDQRYWMQLLSMQPHLDWISDTLVEVNRVCNIDRFTQLSFQEQVARCQDGPFADYIVEGSSGQNRYSTRQIMQYPNSQASGNLYSMPKRPSFVPTLELLAITPSIRQSSPVPFELDPVLQQQAEQYLKHNMQAALEISNNLCKCLNIIPYYIVIYMRALAFFAVICKKDDAIENTDNIGIIFLSCFLLHLDRYYCDYSSKLIQVLGSVLIKHTNSQMVRLNERELKNVLYQIVSAKERLKRHSIKGVLPLYMEFNMLASILRLQDVDRCSYRDKYPSQAQTQSAMNKLSTPRDPQLTLPPLPLGKIERSNSHEQIPHAPRGPQPLTKRQPSFLERLDSGGKAFEKFLSPRTKPKDLT